MIFSEKKTHTHHDSQKICELLTQSTREAGLSTYQGSVEESNPMHHNSLVHVSHIVHGTGYIYLHFFAYFYGKCE